MTRQTLADWYIFQMLPNMKEVAVLNLKQQGFNELFFPTVVTAEYKSKIETEPLFKGYGFIKFDIERVRWLSINSTRGIVKLLPKWTNIPEPMPHGLVDYLIANDPMRIEELVEVFEDYQIGMNVNVTDGRLPGGQKKGTVVSVLNRLVEISFLWNLNDERRMLVKKSALEPVGDS